MGFVDRALGFFRRFFAREHWTAEWYAGLGLMWWGASGLLEGNFGRPSMRVMDSLMPEACWQATAVTFVAFQWWALQRDSWRLRLVAAALMSWLYVIIDLAVLALQHRVGSLSFSGPLTLCCGVALFRLARGYR